MEKKIQTLENFPKLGDHGFLDYWLEGKLENEEKKIELSNGGTEYQLRPDDSKFNDYGIMTTNLLYNYSRKGDKSRILLLDGITFDLSIEYREHFSSADNSTFIGNFFLNGKGAEVEESAYRTINRLLWFYLDKELKQLNVEPIIEAIAAGTPLTFKRYTTPQGEDALVLHFEVNESHDCFGNISWHDYNHWYIIGIERPFAFHLYKDRLDNEC